MMSELRTSFASSKAPWLTNAVLCMLGLGLVLFTREYIWEYGGAGHYVIGASGCSGWSVGLYAAAVLVALTQRGNRATLPIILAIAAAMQLMTLFADPFSSSDVYRYVWDGVVQHHGINPYRYVPGDPALAWLRAPNQDTYDMINRRDYAVTIYPPVAQMVYWLVTFFSPTMQAMKAAMAGFECVTVWALLRLLRRLGRPPQQVLLFAWCPMLAWEIAGAGHIDAAVMAFVTLALLARHHNKAALTGLLLGLAVMTKFYPLVLLPALWMRDPQARGVRRLADWRLPAALLSVVAVGYALYASVGMKVFGFLSGYAQEEGINSGSRFFLLDLLRTLPISARVASGLFYAVAAAVFAGLSWWGWSRAAGERFGASGLSSNMEERKTSPAFLWGSMLLASALMLLFSPHYAWYIVWLVPFFALVPSLTLGTYLMMFFYMFTTALADGSAEKTFRLNTYLYTVVAAAFIVEAVLRRWRRGVRSEAARGPAA